MGRVIISHLAPAQESEIRMLLDLAEALRRRGHQPIIWSAVYDRRFAPYYLPLNWRLKELPNLYADLTRRAVSGLDLEKWRARVNVLIKQEWEGEDREVLLQHLVAVSTQVIETFQPDLILGWNTLCPHTGIACDLNRLAGRKAWLIEKAVFPNSWFIESGGLVGLSELAGVALESLIPKDEMAGYAERGSNYLARTNFATYNRYAQSQTSELMERLSSGDLGARHPRVAFFPPDDGTLGFVPVDGEDRKKTVPGHADSFEAAKALSLVHDGITVYKVHPSLAGHPHNTEGCPDLYVSDYDFRKVIEWADVVSTTGSGLEFVALAMDKPVVLQGNDILAGKGIAYEGQSPGALASAVQQAYAREGFEERRERFHAYCGWLVENYLLSPTDAEGPCLKPDDVAEKLCRECLGGEGSGQDEALFWQARAGLLSDRWRGKLALEAPEEAALRDKPRTELLTEKESALSAARECRDDLILDFDNTLILQNSTERWLDVIRPKTLAFLVVLCCDAFVGFCSRRGWCRADRWRDQVRVAVTTVMFPWAYVWWRVSAKRRMRRYVNQVLSSAVAEGEPREVTVVTFGFQHVVAPLAACLPFKVRLIASNAFSSKGNLRKRGKVDALTKSLGLERLKASLFITDSRDDQEVIDHAGSAALVQWAPYPSPAFSRTYLPMRYAVQGKYAGRKYFKTQILQEDLAIWLLAYAWCPVTLPALLLAFVAMYCVYEIGYWENDHIAAKSEEKPTLSKTAAKFASYPISQGLMWSLASGTGAIVYLGMVNEHFGPVSAGSLLAAPVVWLATMIVLLAAFHVFNRLPITRRPYVFPVLHFIKNFAGAVFIPLQPLGALLLASQVGSQMMVYIAHRSGGSGSAFNRQSQRALLFIVLLAASLITYSTFAIGPLWGPVLPDSASFWSTPVLGWFPGLQLSMILLWMAFRALQRAYGKGFIAILRARWRGTGPSSKA